MAVAKITIEGDLKTTKPRPAADECLAGSSTGNAGGIYYGRVLSRVASDRRSASRSRTRESTADVEEGGDWRRDDGKKKQVFKGKTLLWLVAMPFISLFAGFAVFQGR